MLCCVCTALLLDCASHGAPLPVVQQLSSSQYQNLRLKAQLAGAAWPQQHVNSLPAPAYWWKLSSRAPLPGLGFSWAQVVIQNGEVLAGTLCKKSLGAAPGGLVHIIWMEHGPEAARAFLSQTQYTINQWLLQHGFSIGAGLSA